MTKYLIKFGTTSLMKNGRLCTQCFEDVAYQIKQIRNSHSVVIVTSGAIQAGREYAADRCPDISSFSGADLAGMGNRVYGKWDDAFERVHIPTAMMLITSADLRSDKRMASINSRLDSYTANGVVTLVNANDTTWPDEYDSMSKGLSENDNLAMRLHQHWPFDLFYITTECGGVHDRDPQDPTSRVIPTLSKPEFRRLQQHGLVSNHRSICGSGGMIPKLKAGFGCCGPDTRVAIGPLEGIQDFAWGNPAGTLLTL